MSPSPTSGASKAGGPYPRETDRIIIGPDPTCSGPRSGDAGHPGEESLSGSRPPLLEVSDLRVHFGRTPALDGISFRIAPGETLAFVGESGSGKSTAALALLRLLPGSARIGGGIRFFGDDLLALPEGAMRRLRGRAISMIFQEPMTALNPVMPIGKQIAEALVTHRPELTRAEIRARVLQSLREVALPDPEQRLRHYPHQFSGGQRQRILIAMSLINRPHLLIADEPTTALDVTVQAQILDLLRSLQRTHGLAMLFVSHDLAVVSHLADHVAVMRHGRIVESASASQLFRHPQHPYTQQLLASAPTMETDRDRPLATVDHAGTSVEANGSAVAEKSPGKP